MKPFLKKILATLIVLCVAFSVIACVGREIQYGDDNMAIITYPDLPRTPSDKNSWEYIGNETLTIDWYVDFSAWNPVSGLDVVSKRIKEVTGITINFDTPIDDSGQKLATMLSGDLPDIITVPASNIKVLASLAQQGFVYDINTLAERWAPSLKRNLPQDVWDWWAYGNGKTYGIPNHYYSYEHVPEGQLQPNGGMMVRKDIFDAWQAHVESTLKDSNGYVNYTSLSGQSKKVQWQGYITTPEGFKAAAKWAMENYSELTSGLLLSQFKSDGNLSIEVLSQFFAVPFEDSKGNWQYKFTQQGYADMLYYLNELYREGIISNANFTHGYDEIGSVVASGNAFATLVTPQDYQMHFVTAKESGKEYISMYLTNEKGDAPVLSDIRGYGFLFNMITTHCERPDIVIKLFDYLTSEEGQLLVAFGVEGETWEWNEEKSAIRYTTKYLNEKALGQTAKYGLMQFDLLLNYQFYDNVQPKVNHGKTESELYRTNLKRPLTIYSYDCNANAFIVDATDSKFSDYSTAVSRINSVIGTQLPKIIKAKTAGEAKTLYQQTVSILYERNLDLVIDMNKKAYQKAKTKLGISKGWPPYQSGYKNPLDRTKPNGDLSLYRTY